MQVPWNVANGIQTDDGVRNNGAQVKGDGVVGRSKITKEVPGKFDFWHFVLSLLQTRIWPFVADHLQTNCVQFNYTFRGASSCLGTIFSCS